MIRPNQIKPGRTWSVESLFFIIHCLSLDFDKGIVVIVSVICAAIAPCNKAFRASIDPRLARIDIPLFVGNWPTIHIYSRENFTTASSVILELTTPYMTGRSLPCPLNMLALWESLQNAPISCALSERTPQNRVSRARGVERSLGCWLSRSSAV